MAIKIGDMVATLGVDSKGLDAGLQKAQKGLQDLGKTMAVAGGAIVALGIASVKTYADMGDAVLDMSKRTGMSTEAISELAYAAQTTGTSIQGIEVALKIMARGMLDAQSGTGGLYDSLGKLGLTLSDLQGLKPEAQFQVLAGAIGAVDDPTLRAGLALDVFGRSGTQLLPLLAEGADGMARLRQEAHDIGVVFDQEAAEACDRFNDAMVKLKSAATGLRNEIGSALMPALEDAAADLTGIAVAARKATEANPELASSLTKVAFEMGLLTLAGGSLILLLPKLRGLTQFLSLEMGALAVAFGLLLFAIDKALEPGRQIAIIEAQIAANAKVMEDAVNSNAAAVTTAATQYAAAMELVAKSERKALEELTAWSDAIGPAIKAALDQAVVTRDLTMMQIELHRALVFVTDEIARATLAYEAASKEYEYYLDLNKRGLATADQVYSAWQRVSFAFDDITSAQQRQMAAAKSWELVQVSVINGVTYAMGQLNSAMDYYSYGLGLGMKQQQDWEERLKAAALGAAGAAGIKLPLGMQNVAAAWAALKAAGGWEGLTFDEIVQGIINYLSKQWGTATARPPATSAALGATMTSMGGSRGGVVINVQGSVVTERELVDVMRRGLLQVGSRNANVGLS